MAATHHWRSHDHRAGQYLMPHLYQRYISGHCNHQHASCRCHGGYHDNHHFHHHGAGGHHHHHGNNHQHHYHQGNAHHHHRSHHTEVIHRHYTEQDNSTLKLLPLPPSKPKPDSKAVITSADQSDQSHDQVSTTQHEESQVQMPCPKCEGARCTVHNTEAVVIFQCAECEAEKDFKKHHQEAQAQFDCPECDDKRCAKFEAETQVKFDCEVCERSRCIKHDAETQVATSCPDCDRSRYCKNDKEMQVVLDCKVCEGRRQVTTRDMATQVEEFDVKVTEEKEEGIDSDKNREQEKSCKICSVLLERLKESNFLDEETIGSYVITKTASKPKVKVTKKESKEVKKSFRTSTPRQGPFDTFAQNLRDFDY